MEARISRRALARRHGLSEGAIRAHIDNGNLAAAVLPNGDLDPVIAERLLAETVQHGKLTPTSLRSAKTRRLRAQVAGLLDSVEEMRADSISPADAAAFRAEAREPVVERIQRLVRDCSRAAGMDGRQALTTLTALVHEVLTDLSDPAFDDPYGAAEEPAEPSAPARPDLATMTPNALTALRINLTAELMETEQALANGRALPVADVMAEWEETLTTAKSLLLALPGRVAPLFAVGGARERVRAEVEEVVAALA